MRYDIFTQNGVLAEKIEKSLGIEANYDEGFERLDIPEYGFFDLCEHKLKRIKNILFRNSEDFVIKDADKNGRVVWPLPAASLDQVLDLV